MSGLCAILDLAGAPVWPADLEPMIDAMSERASSGVTRSANSTFAGAVLVSRPARGVRLAGTPALSGQEGVTVLADARIDNREELAKTLELDLPETEQILAAGWERWGSGLPARLRGDFAFVLWDHKRRLLFCARDPVGVRPLHYARSGTRLLIASTVGSVAAAFGPGLELNRELAQDFLAGRLARWVDETIFRQVRRLPVGHALEAAPEGTSLRRYRTLGDRPAPRYRRDEEYAEHLRELLRDAVAARLEDGVETGILVSGGLDSSSLACLADELTVRSGAARGPTLYSCVFRRHPAANELDYLDAVIARCKRLRPVLLQADDCWGFREMGGDRGFRLDEPEISGDRSLLLRPLRRARRDGCRVILGGFGGDQILGGDAYGTLGSLRDVPWYRVPIELPNFSSRGGVRGLAAVASRLGSRLARAAGGRRRGAMRPLAEASGAPWADPLPPPPLASFTSRRSYQLVTGGSFAAQMSAVDAYAADVGVEVRFPFLDCRVIDFMLSLPARFKFAGGVEKVLLRQAMQGLIPPVIARRKSYAHFTELLTEGLCEKERDRVEDLLRDSRLVRLSLVDDERLREHWLYSKDYGNLSANTRCLVRAICLESWLRQRPEYQEQGE